MNDMSIRINMYVDSNSTRLLLLVVVVLFV